MLKINTMMNLDLLMLQRFFLLCSFFFSLKAMASSTIVPESSFVQAHEQLLSAESSLEKDPLLSSLNHKCQQFYQAMREWQQIRDRLLTLEEKNLSLTKDLQILKVSVRADLERNLKRVQRERHLMERKIKRMRDTWIKEGCPPLQTYTAKE